MGADGGENKSLSFMNEGMNWVATHLGPRCALGLLFISVGTFLGVDDPGSEASRYSQFKALAGMGFILIGMALVVGGYILSKVRPTRVVIWVATYSNQFPKQKIKSILRENGLFWVSFVTFFGSTFAKLSHDPQKIEEFLQRFAKKCISHRELFFGGIAHLPLVARLGYLLRDFNIKFLEVSHSSREPVLLVSQENAASKDMIVSNTSSLSKSECVVVTVSISFGVDGKNLPNHVNALPVAEIKLNQLQSSAVRSQSDLVVLKEDVAKALKAIQEVSCAKIVHLFYAGPTSLLFLLAQGFHRNTNPEYLVYHRDQSSGYTWALSANGSELT